MLQRLIQATGPAVLSSFAGGALSHLAQPGATAQEADANAITPTQAGEIAGAARQSNPGIVSELASFYAQRPTLVKTLGAAALAIAMSKMASHAYYCLASALVLGATIALAMKMVAAARGLEIQTSFWLVDESWIRFLVSMAVCVAVVVIGLVSRALQQRREARAWQEHEARWGADRKPDL